ncbi:TIGR03086 family metal-binding protein [Streptacidiphilus sp. N1-12]|uniref:TIGR03086 family metal-binding protein n=2 Tax=Streptacidiphilus alkalitolerans TaxID=3342712 RepID=A0ABV6W934_9ACTN
MNLSLSLSQLDQLDQLDRAFASTRSVLAKVGPEQLGDPTPCASWDVRGVIDHMVGSAYWAAAVVGAGGESTGADLASGDLLAGYDECARVTLAAFGAEGPLRSTFQLPFGEFSGAALLGLVANDQFTHGWDLARAIGLPTDLDPELAEVFLERSRDTVTESYRGADGEAQFGPELPAPPGAGPADRLAAFLGRRV